MKSWHMVALTMAGALGLLGAVFVVVPRDNPAPLPKGGVSLSKPEGKIDAADLMHHYTRIGFTHPLDGKTVEVRIPDRVWCAPDGAGNVCLSFDADKGFRRPAFVARTRNKWGSGAKPVELQTVRVHGRLVGLVDYKLYPEFKDWSALVPGRYAPAFDRVALLEDAVLIDD